MSFKGEIEAKCPKGCEAFTAEVWSFIRGDQSQDLRLAVMFRECNMILCPGCQAAFFAPAPYVYFESQLELLAFVFPESYKEKEAYWRDKMHEDFEVFKTSLGAEVSLDVEPEIFFGTEGLALLLENEDYRGEEREVMEFVAKELGLSLYRVSPVYAREKNLPSALPFEGGAADRASVIAGLKKLLAANDRLTAYQAYLDMFAAGKAPLPPASKIKTA
ncbi:MAG: CpXC domain-containing protein [Elusimicrobiota bacterium]